MNSKNMASTKNTITNKFNMSKNTINFEKNNFNNPKYKTNDYNKNISLENKALKVVVKDILPKVRLNN
jgi:hypothetical protein